MGQTFVASTSQEVLTAPTPDAPGPDPAWLPNTSLDATDEKAVCTPNNLATPLEFLISGVAFHSPQLSHHHPLAANSRMQGPPAQGLLGPWSAASDKRSRGPTRSFDCRLGHSFRSRRCTLRMSSECQLRRSPRLLQGAVRRPNRPLAQLSVF
jgi:hypothetical protein